MRNRVVLALAGVLCLAAVPGISGYSKKEERRRRPPVSEAAHQRSEDSAGAQPADLRPSSRRRPGSEGDGPQEVDRPATPSRRASPRTRCLREKLKTLDTLQMSGSELVRNYPTPQMVRQMVNGQLPFPADPDRKLMLTKLMAKFEERQAKGGDAAAAPTATERANAGRTARPAATAGLPPGHAASSDWQPSRRSRRRSRTM